MQEIVLWCNVALKLSSFYHQTATDRMSKLYKKPIMRARVQTRDGTNHTPLSLSPSHVVILQMKYWQQYRHGLAWLPGAICVSEYVQDPIHVERLLTPDYITKRCTSERMMREGGRQPECSLLSFLRWFKVGKLPWSCIPVQCNVENDLWRYLLILWYLRSLFAGNAKQT